MGEWDALREKMESFLAAEADREVSEGGELLFDLRESHYRLEEAHGKLLLHLWSEERNWVRRVVGVAEETRERLVLEVERFERRPGRLAIATPRRRATVDRERAAARRKYVGLLRRLLQREFPRARVEGLSAARDLKLSFSGLYTRARLREGERWWVVLGVGAGEDSAAVDGILTYALVWLDWNRRRYPERVWAGLRLFLPVEHTQTTASRLAFLDRRRMRAELFAVDEAEFTCVRVDLRDWGNRETRMAPLGRAQAIRTAESSAVERIRALAPTEIETSVPAARDQLVLRIRGLEFARAAGGRVRFGVGREEQELTPGNFSDLAGLVERLRRERTAGGTPASPYYRLQAESWLESAVLAAPRAVDARLERERLYRQVFVAGGGERGVADLLGATRDGQLVVLELKASTDIHLPLQGLDYWMRVHWHQQRGELAGAGYFPGVQLKATPPELLLVAPALQFHPTTEALVQFFAPAVRVTLVGLNEDWRRELKVVRRQSR